MTKRPVLRLRTEGLVPSDEDRRIDLHIYDLLLPCRRYGVSYKVAVLGRVSPTLEFLLRLVKVVPGVAEAHVRSFFGYSRIEMEYVLNEGVLPGYIDRKQSKLWLTSTGEALFIRNSDEPTLYAVEPRRGSYGFDLLSVSPERQRALDGVEIYLPELTPEGEIEIGKLSKAIPDRFRRFFRELGERSDRELVQKKDLYSIDDVLAGDRYQIPVRIKVFAQASTPSSAELDLTSWRSDQELSDRPQVEKAAGKFLSELKVARHAEQDAAAYALLISLAPDFFKDFTITAGLSVNRYWREAVSRVGEARIDRKTIPLAGALVTQENIEKILRVVDYGTRRDNKLPREIVMLPPQRPFWGSTTLLRELFTILRVKLRGEDREDESEIKACCIYAGRCPKYVAAAFDRIDAIDTSGLPAPVEMLVIPNVAAVVTVHSPIGAIQGISVPLGFATFDPEVLGRAQALVIDSVMPFIGDIDRRRGLEELFQHQK